MSGAVPPPTARPLERAARVPRPVCPGCGRCGRVDPAPAPQRAPLRAGIAHCGGGGRASPGGGAFHRCEGRPASGAVPPPAARPLERAARVPRPVCPGCGRCGRVDPAPAPQRVRPCGPALPAVGVAEGRPRGGCLPPLRGAPGVRRCPSPGGPSSGAGSQGSATRVSRVRSMRACEPSTGPPACALAGRRCSLWGWQKGVPGGGAFHRCEGRLVSGAVPPPAARPLEQAARVPRPLCPGCGRSGRVDPAPAPQCAPLPAGVARCGSGGKGVPRGGCLPPLWGAPGVRRCPSPDRPSSGAGSQGSATRVSRVRSMRACEPSTGPPACALAGWRCSLWGWPKGVPGGGAFHRCEGRLVSGAVPPPAARPLEQAARVPRPVCPGCGRCGRVDPAPAPQRAPLRAGVARCGGGGRASLGGGVPSTVVRGAWCQALSLPRPPVLRSVQPGFRDPCVPGAVDAGLWTQHRPHGVRPCGPALLAVGVAEGRPRGGVPSTVVRGAWCQALSLPRTPVLRSVQPGFRDPCVPGAVDAGVWTQHRPHSVRPCGLALLAVGVAEGRPRGGGAFHRCEGRLVSGAVPPPAARPPERAARVPRPVCPGCGRCGRVDPAPAPQRAPLRAGVARCGGGGRASPGGGAFHRCEGRLVSGAVPPPAARPPERAARVPRPACPGRGRCGRGDPAPAPQRAPLRAGVARCGGGGRASPGGGCLPPL